MRGLEPPPLSGHDPKSCASASSATSAIVFSMYYTGKLFFKYTVLPVLLSLLTDSSLFLGTHFSPKTHYTTSIFNATNFDLQFALKNILSRDIVVRGMDQVALMRNRVINVILLKKTFDLFPDSFSLQQKIQFILS